MNAQKIESKLWIYLCKSLVTDIRGILKRTIYRLLGWTMAAPARCQAFVFRQQTSALRFECFLSRDLSEWNQKLNNMSNNTQTERCTVTNNIGTDAVAILVQGEDKKLQKILKTAFKLIGIFSHSVKFSCRTKHYNCGEWWVIFPGSTED